MIAISTKEFRLHLPDVLQQVQQGAQFLLIYNSVPVAEISKPKSIKTFVEASDRDIEEASLTDISEEFLNEKELNYYLSLK